MRATLSIPVIVIGLAGSLTAQLVTTERLTGSDREPQNWLMYSGSYASQRYSTLDQVTRDNARNLELQWVYHCLLYTSDAADERSSVDLGGRRIIKKKN